MADDSKYNEGKSSFTRQESADLPPSYSEVMCTTSKKNFAENSAIKIDKSIKNEPEFELQSCNPDFTHTEFQTITSQPSSSAQAKNFIVLESTTNHATESCDNSSSCTCQEFCEGCLLACTTSFCLFTCDVFCRTILEACCKCA